ncbi:MAG TPA: FAD-dependent oxidoreductase [Rhizomicrobium sp.]|jgi:2-polyprenyl-6-methoxyphenol hydroxylase-like FAD-dependent oxidoreductase
MSLSTHVVIAGGGPAGMFCGYLLARGGIDVVVLEKHADFLRDFRGDTVHPSTLEVMHELGLLDEFLALPHQEVRHLHAEIGNRQFTIGDFTHLPTHCKFIALMPQWDLLNFLAEKAKAFPQFRLLLMKTKAVDLIEESGEVVGVRADGESGEFEFRASLVIGADGRHSTMREKSGLPLREFGVPIDVIWLKLPLKDSDPTEPVARLAAGRFFVMLYRGDYWQCALVVPKGGFDEIKREGIDAFSKRLSSIAGFAADRVDAIKSFDDVSLLTVTVDRLTRWAKPGLLCIGDAAHAMSPVGGVGINLAIQDAVAAANILWRPLRSGKPSLGDLAKVQACRELPVRLTQAAQVAIQNNIVAPTLQSAGELKPPLFVRLLDSVPLLQRIPARAVGLGVRPEHVSHDLLAAQRND